MPSWSLAGAAGRAACSARTPPQSGGLHHRELEPSTAVFSFRRKALTHENEMDSCFPLSLKGSSNILLLPKCQIIALSSFLPRNQSTIPKQQLHRPERRWMLWLMVFVIEHSCYLWDGALGRKGQKTQEVSGNNCGTDRSQ